MYRIAWRSLLTGYESHGDYLFETEDDIKQIIESLNTQFSGMIAHWAEAV